MDQYNKFKNRYNEAKELASKDIEGGLKLFNDLISDINDTRAENGDTGKLRALLVRCIKQYGFIWYRKRENSTFKKDRKPRFLKEHLNELTDNSIQPDLLKEILKQVASKHYDSAKKNHYLNKLISDLKDEEGSQIEVKKSLILREPIGKTISAFANTSGGKVFVGIAELKNEPDDTGGVVINNTFLVVGLYKDIDQHRAHLTSHLDKSLSINLDLLTFNILEINSKRIMIITVPSIYKNTNEITFYENEAYQRVDNHNKKLTTKEVYQFTTVSVQNRQKTSNTPKLPRIKLKSNLIWATNYAGFGAGFNCELSIDNFGRNSDYITEVKLVGFDGRSNPWETIHFKIDEHRLNGEFEIDKNKIITTGIFLSDDKTEGRLTPDLDIDRLKLITKFRSGEQSVLNLKPAQIQGIVAKS